jgi:hypothetical protein
MSMKGTEKSILSIPFLHCVQWRDHLWNRVCDDVVNNAQQVMQKGDGDAAKAHDLLENFASLHIDEAIAATDERMKIRKSLGYLAAYSANRISCLGTISQNTLLQPDRCVRSHRSSVVFEKRAVFRGLPFF